MWSLHTNFVIVNYYYIRYLNLLRDLQIIIKILISYILFYLN